VSNSNSNSNSNGGRSWRDTEILITRGAIETDALRNLFRDREWWRAFEASKNPKKKQFLHDAVDSLVAEPRRSTAMDALDDFDEPSRQYLSGLRFYFDHLKPDEPLNVHLVRALLQNIMQNL
jgi:hypothetical protein